MKNSSAIIFLVLFGILIFGLVFRGTWGNPSAEELAQSTNNPIRIYGTTTDRGRFVLTRNLVEEHSFKLDRMEADASSPDAGYYKGNWYLLYAPGTSILATPFYKLGSYFNLELVGSFALSTVTTLGSLIFIFLISRRILKLPIWLSLFSSFVFGFGSIAIGYTSGLFQHHTTTFFIISSLYAVFQYKNSKKSILWALYVWLAYGIAISLDYPNIFLMLPVMIYFLVASFETREEDKKYKIRINPIFLMTSVVFISLSLVHGYYNYKHFGGWNKLSSNLPDYRQNIHRYLDEGNMEQAIEEVTINKGERSPVSVFTENKITNGLYELLVAKDKGLFFFNPIFIFGLFGIILAFKKMTLEKGILIALIGANLFLYSSWADPWGGWVYGPRYLIPSMATLSIFVAYAMHPLRYKFFPKIVAFILFAGSAAISLIGALTTNSVPPKVEAIFLNIKYGIPYAYDFLIAGQSNSFTYNQFFSSLISLKNYYLAILSLIILMVFIVLFIMPKFEKKYEPVD